MDKIIRETAVLLLTANLSDEIMSVVVRKIYEFVPPLSRRSILKFITLDWMLRQDFIVVDGRLDSEMLEKNEFYVDCDGFPIQVSFTEFVRGDSPYYRVQFLDDNSVMNGIRIFKTAFPLFSKKNTIPKEELLFIREFYANLQDALMNRMITMKLKGLPSDGPTSITGPESYRNDSLSVSPPRIIQYYVPSEDLARNVPVEPMPTQDIPRSRSRSPINQPPLTPGANLNIDENYGGVS